MKNFLLVVSVGMGFRGANVEQVMFSSISMGMARHRCLSIIVYDIDEKAPMLGAQG